MRKIMVLTLSMLCALVVYSSAVFAWDDLIYIDRHAKIGAQGDMLGALGIRYSTAGDRYDKDSKKQNLGDNTTGFRVPLWGRYNIIDNLDAFAILPVVSVDDGVNSESGIGDIWLGAKYAIMPGGTLTVRGALDIPSGDDKKGLGNVGGFGIDIAAMTEQKIEKLSVFAQLGVRYNGEDGDTKWKPGIGFYIQGRTGYDITDRFPGWVSLTYFNQGDGEADGSKMSNSLVNWLEVEVGGSYKITNELWVSVPLQYTLTGTNTMADLGIGVVVGYYLGK